MLGDRLAHSLLIPYTGPGRRLPEATHIRNRGHRRFHSEADKKIMVTVDQSGCPYPSLQSGVMPAVYRNVHDRSQILTGRPGRVGRRSVGALEPHKRGILRLIFSLRSRFCIAETISYHMEADFVLKNNLIS